eukprot:1159086-Pelagomonas_calceolata.AAC.14
MSLQARTGMEGTAINHLHLMIHQNISAKIDSGQVGFLCCPSPGCPLTLSFGCAGSDKNGGQQGAGSKPSSARQQHQGSSSVFLTEGGGNTGERRCTQASQWRKLLYVLLRCSAPHYFCKVLGSGEQMPLGDSSAASYTHILFSRKHLHAIQCSSAVKTTRAP